MLLAVLAAATALLTDTQGSGPPPAAPPQPTPARVDCSTVASVELYWQPGIAAYREGDKAAARANVEAIIAACGTAEPTWGPRTMAADIALENREFDRVIAVLEPVPRARGATGGVASYLLLRALQARQDAAAFGREREALVRAAVQGLTDPAGPIHGRLIETFTEGGAQVFAVEAELQQRGFVRRYEFLIIPAAPLEMPTSIMLSRDPAAEALDREHPVLFVDRYTCEGHQTMGIVPANPAPDYAAVREMVRRAIAPDARPVSGMSPSNVHVCAWPQFVTPGVGR